MGPDTRRYNSTHSAVGADAFRDSHHAGSSLGLFQSYCDNDGGTVCGRRSYFQYRAGKNDRSAAFPSGQRQPHTSFSCSGAGYGCYRRIREQHGHRCAHAAYCCLHGGRRGRNGVAISHASGFRFEYGRHAHSHRHASQPRDCRSMGGIQRRGSLDVFVSAGRFGMSRRRNASAHTAQQNALRQKEKLGGVGR